MEGYLLELRSGHNKLALRGTLDGVWPAGLTVGCEYSAAGSV